MERRQLLLLCTLSKRSDCETDVLPTDCWSAAGRGRRNGNQSRHCHVWARPRPFLAPARHSIRIFRLLSFVFLHACATNATCMHSGTTVQGETPEQARGRGHHQKPRKDVRQLAFEPQTTLGKVPPPHHRSPREELTGHRYTKCLD